MLVSVEALSSFLFFFVKGDRLVGRPWILFPLLELGWFAVA